MFLLQKSRFERYLELLTGILRQPLLKYEDFSTIEKRRFYGLNNLLLIEQRYQTTKPRSLLQKRRHKRYLELLTGILRQHVLKYANFSTIRKCRFYGLKRLLLRKQHRQTTKPRSLLKKRRLKRYLDLLTRIMG